MNLCLIRASRIAPVARAALALVLATALGACAVHTTTGAALHAGESATLRLTGSPAWFEIANTGDQPLEYTLAENGVVTSRGSIGPRGMAAESCSADEIVVTITNPGPGTAHASLEARSRRGMEFRRPEPQATQGS